MKITATFPKDFAHLNGLLVHSDEIAEHGLTAPAGEAWEGYAVVKLEAPETTRFAETGAGEPKLAIVAIELMEGAREHTVRTLLKEVYAERVEAGTLLDDGVVGDDPADDPAVAATARRLRSVPDFDPVDRYEDPDAAPRYAGRPIASVNLPDDRVGVDPITGLTWSPADDTGNAS